MTHSFIHKDTLKLLVKQYIIETQRDQLTLNRQETDEHTYVRLWGKNEQDTGSPYEEKWVLNSHHT